MQNEEQAKTPQEELEEMLAKSDGADEQPTLLDNLASMAKTLTDTNERLAKGYNAAEAKSYGAGDEKDDVPSAEEDEQEKDPDSARREMGGDSMQRSRGASQTFDEELDKSSEFAEMKDGSPALRELAGAMSKAFAALDARLNQRNASLEIVQKSIAAIGGGVGTLCESNVVLHKSLGELPASQPDRGVTGTHLEKGADAADEAVEGGLTKSEVGLRIERAVQDQKIDHRTLSLFDADPNRALGTIPNDIRKSFDIPVSMNGVALS